MGIRNPSAFLLSPKWHIPADPRIRFSTLTVGLFSRRPLREWAFIASLFMYSLVCVYIYIQWVQPWIAGDITIRIGADSDRYWEAAEMAQSSGLPNLVSLTGNFFGPVVMIFILRTGFAIMCFNLLLFLTALKIAFSIDGVEKFAFGFLMLLNAELLPALTTLNKEIFTLLAAVLTAKYIHGNRKSNSLLLIILFISFLARWEAAAILIVFLILYGCWPFRGHPKTAIAVVVAILTIVYPLLFTVLGIDPSMFDYLLGGANTIITLNAIQAHYGFPIVLIPKIVMLIGGKLSSPLFYAPNSWLTADYRDIQQTIFQPLGCLALVIVFIFSMIKQKLNAKRPIALLIFITLIVSAVAPFIQPRYLYPVYVLLCIELARREGATPSRVLA